MADFASTARTWLIRFQYAVLNYPTSIRYSQSSVYSMGQQFHLELSKNMELY